MPHAWYRKNSLGEKLVASSCCGDIHPFDRFNVERLWRPSQLRCLIIGENPGGPQSPYFYDPPENYSHDPVIVRRALLQNLYQQNILQAATLEEFKKAGFLFDHALRCPLQAHVVKIERRRAREYASVRVHNPTHLLTALIQAPIVWVMGHLACNAVANSTTEFPKELRRLSRSPYPGALSPHSRFFVSAYLARWNKKEWGSICEAFREFALRRNVLKLSG